MFPFLFEVVLLSQLFGIMLWVAPSPDLLEAVFGQNVKVRVLDTDDSCFQV